MYSSIWGADRETNFRFGIRFASFRFSSFVCTFDIFFSFVPVKCMIFKFSENTPEWVNYRLIILVLFQIEGDPQKEKVKFKKSFIPS